MENHYSLMAKCQKCRTEFVPKNRKHRCCSRRCINALWYRENKAKLLRETGYTTTPEKRANKAKYKNKRYHSDPKYRFKEIERAKRNRALRQIKR